MGMGMGIDKDHARSESKHGAATFALGSINYAYNYRPTILTAGTVL